MSEKLQCFNQRLPSKRFFPKLPNLTSAPELALVFDWELLDFTFDKFFLKNRAKLLTRRFFGVIIPSKVKESQTGWFVRARPRKEKNSIRL
jgi:hypothetical protein